MISTTFSAEVPINVSINALRLNGSSTGHVYVMLPRSHVVNITKIYDYNPGVVTVFDDKWSNNTGVRNLGNANFNVRYEVQGRYNIVVYSVDVTPTNAFEPNCNEINIGSLEVTSTAKLNKYSLLLTQESTLLAENSDRLSRVIVLLAVYETVLGILVAINEYVKKYQTKGSPKTNAGELKGKISD